jgi:hypothetical protein
VYLLAEKYVVEAIFDAPPANNYNGCTWADCKK